MERLTSSAALLQGVNLFSLNAAMQKNGSLSKMLIF
jgi:hypothetical protein